MDRDRAVRWRRVLVTLAMLFIVVLLVNLMPAFAPPTWMAMSWIGFNVPEGKPLVFAVVAASAATLGRLVLATFARSLVRGHEFEGALEHVPHWFPVNAGGFHGHVGTAMGG